ncbi:hypothetical protein PRIEUP_LOCUS1243 [Pristimantis euphronides]
MTLLQDRHKNYFAFDVMNLILILILIPKRITQSSILKQLQVQEHQLSLQGKPVCDVPAVVTLVTNHDSGPVDAIVASNVPNPIVSAEGAPLEKMN